MLRARRREGGSRMSWTRSTMGFSEPTRCMSRARVGGRKGHQGANFVSRSGGKPSQQHLLWCVCARVRNLYNKREGERPYRPEGGGERGLYNRGGEINAVPDETCYVIPDG